VSRPLVLMRHGQSEWNERNLFTGWADPDLTAAGEREAVGAGRLLAAHGLPPGFAHTSLQRRAVRSTELALAACGRASIPVRRSRRLNGRNYGALQGRDKDEVVREYGKEQVQLWRRSYAVAPPRGESLRDVTARLLPYWHDSIVPDLRSGECVLVVSHGNTLRALIKHLDGIGDDEIAGLEIPNAVPLIYQLDTCMRPLTRGGRRLAG
jgi:2,3-bisphosphoglycerate-dependent phosphoglycerate mutase